MDAKNLLIRGGGVADIPWLLLPHGEGPLVDKQRLYLSFYSLSEDRFYNLKLPKQAQGGYCCGSSKGWLAIINTTARSELNPQLFLWRNPLLSGPILELPSLTTIPNFEELMDRLPDIYNVSRFIDRIDVSLVSSSSSAAAEEQQQLIVALLCKCKTTLAFCKLGDKSWSIFTDDTYYYDILFSNNILHVLDVSIDYGRKSSSTVVEAHHTNIGNLTHNGGQVMIKSIKHFPNWEKLPYYKTQPGGFVIGKHVTANFGLVESAQGELLMTRMSVDLFMNEEDFEEEEEDFEEDLRQETLDYHQTTGFEIFKVNVTNSSSGGGGQMMMHGLTDLGNQMLFCTDHGSVAIPTSMKLCHPFREGNCIYFILTPYWNVLRFVTKVNREAGVFYLEDGRIKRHLPSFKLPTQSNPFWFTYTKFTVDS